MGDDLRSVALLAVEGLHSRRDFHGDGYGWTVCAECRQAWPCETICTIDRLLMRERHRNGEVKAPANASQEVPNG